jgi:hypothetical protein
MLKKVVITEHYFNVKISLSKWRAKIFFFNVKKSPGA